MKKLLAVALFSTLFLASCAKRYTCPTYLQNDTQEEDVRVSTKTVDSETSKN